MSDIKSLYDINKYLKSKPLYGICWYGPRDTNIPDPSNLLSFDGIISCYCNDIRSKKTPTLSNDLAGRRKKCSSDDLAGKLISNSKLSSFIKKNNITTILPYDSNPELEVYCKNNHIRYLSSPDSLKNILRDKTKIDIISQKINLPSIPGVSGVINNFEYAPLVKKLGTPLFLHFAEGAGGSGNRIVNTPNEFEKIKKEESGKKLNIKQYFIGRSCSIDICVTPREVICGTLEEMLIGAEPLNSNPTEYVGSSWFQNDYSYNLRKKILSIGIALGELVRSQGYIGYFHPDFLVVDDDVYLTELNMRFGGSCGVYANIQIMQNQIPLMIIHALTFHDPTIRFNAKIINQTNLYPLDYALIILKNNFGKPIIISHKFKSGIYNINGNKLKMTDHKDFKNFTNANTIFINGLPDSKIDTVIDEGAFICEVVTRFPISNTKSKLNSRGKSLVDNLFSQIIID